MSQRSESPNTSPASARKHNPHPPSSHNVPEERRASAHSSERGGHGGAGVGSQQGSSHQGDVSEGAGDGESHQEEEHYTPVPPPLKFDLDGDDVPTRGDLRKWCKASAEERDFLARRVKRLKQEEAQALKKLSTTEERTQKLELQKQAHTARRAEHQRHRENVLRTQHRERTLVSLARQRESRALMASKAKIQLEKKERVMTARKQHAINELIVLSRQEERKEKLRSQKGLIKEAQSTWRAERGQEMAMIRKERYRSSLEELMNDRETNVNQSARLVTEEAALLLRLHMIKNKNSAALSKLSSVIGSNSHHGDHEHDDDDESVSHQSKADSRRQQQHDDDDDDESARLKLPPV